VGAIRMALDTVDRLARQLTNAMMKQPDEPDEKND
jgi:hypothetical protein